MINGHRLRLLSYNIQAGLSTDKYAHYVTRGWQHVLPVRSRMANLDGIAKVIGGYDLVALQEVDTGSLRSGFVDQAKYLAERAHFPYAYNQNNRRIGTLTQHSNAVLSRFEATHISGHKLPGLIPGRGVLRLQFGIGDTALQVAMMHLALGKRNRIRQMRYVAELIAHYRYVVVMGDLNCCSDSRELRELLRVARSA